MGTAKVGSTSRWSASAITSIAALTLSGRTSVAISSSSGTDSAGGSPANTPKGDRPPREVPRGRGARPAARAHLLLAERSPSMPRRCRRGSGSRQAGMVAGELQRDGAAPGDAGDVRGAELERLDQRREAVRVVGEPEAPLGHVGGAPRARLRPRRRPSIRRAARRAAAATCDCPVVAAVHEHERRPLTDAAVCDFVGPFALTTSIAPTYTQAGPASEDFRQVALRRRAGLSPSGTCGRSQIRCSRYRSGRGGGVRGAQSEPDPHLHPWKAAVTRSPRVSMQLGRAGGHRPYPRRTPPIRCTQASVAEFRRQTLALDE